MSGHPRVKICGLRELEHALVAAECGANFIGFVFAPARRRIEPARAREIVRQVPNCPSRVGLFVNESPELVNSIADEVGLDYVQLCGDETPEYLAQINRPAIKSIAVSDANSLTGVQDYHDRGATVQFDAYAPGQRGGTGISFDWSIFEHNRPRFPFVLAGGLNPDNVSEAIRIARPWGVDVSSGVEIDGRKDSNLIVDFVQAARSVRS